MLALAMAVMMSVSRMQIARRRFGLVAYTQRHHIIPRQFARHPAIVKSGLSVEADANFMLTPNTAGRSVLNTRRPDHDGGHWQYNRYVGKRLDHLLASCVDSSELLTRVEQLRFDLRQGVRRNDVPWK